MKALALFSGGLDSMLSMKLITSQNIEVTALYMDNGFGASPGKFDTLKKRAAMAGADFRVVNIKRDYVKNVLFTPKYGYGKHFNPCIDCHGFMFNTAFSLLNEENADFIISGEVLGQRPMSKRKAALNSVLHLSGGDEDLILRPMCAKLLPPSKPERLKWVDREKLLGISGRGRKTQLALAKEFGFSDFESPAGGCLLTLENFSNKLREHTKFSKTLSDSDIALLRLGRHLRLENGAKMIIGRNEAENEKISAIRHENYDEIELPSDIMGALSLLQKDATQEEKSLAAQLALTYAKADPLKTYTVKIATEEFECSPLQSKDEAAKFFV